MKKNMNLSIPKPCSEDWNAFTKTAIGGFCHSCQKNVVDFTKMSDQEVVTFIMSNKHMRCGKFLPSQLKRYEVAAAKETTSLKGWLQASALSLGLLWGGETMAISNAAADETVESVHAADQTNQKVKRPGIVSGGVTITGVVNDSEGYALPGATVVIKGSSHGTYTDIEGHFELKDVQEGDVLLISFIGFETLAYTIHENAPETFVLALEMSHDLTGEVVIAGVYTSSPFSRFWQGVKSVFRRK